VRYVKTRKIDLTLKDPADIFEEAKRRMENIPRLEDVDEGREVLTYSSIFEENYNEYLENKKKGVVACEFSKILLTTNSNRSTRRGTLCTNHDRLFNTKKTRIRRI
jgi:hypothetical protein